MADSSTGVFCISCGEETEIVKDFYIEEGQLCQECFRILYIQ